MNVDQNFSCRFSAALFLYFMSSPLAFAEENEVKIDVPPNAHAFGSSWLCNQGYKKRGDGCVKIDVPPNAHAYGSSWLCNQGYKKRGDGCTTMSPQEAEAQKKALSAAARASRDEEFFVDDERFTLREIARKCEVYRYSENYGDVECSGSKFRVIERKCEAYFYDAQESSGEIECRGSELRKIERHCTVEMYSDDYGDMSC